MGSEVLQWVESWAPQQPLWVRMRSSWLKVSRYKNGLWGVGIFNTGQWLYMGGRLLVHE